MRTVTALLLASLLAFAAAVPEARAVTVGGRSSTQAFFFSDDFGKDHLDLAEYLRVGIASLDADNTVRINGYGRATGDAYAGGGVDGRLYNLYLDKGGLPLGTDVRLGRQLLFVSAGSALVDGARLQLRSLGPLSLSLGGGRDVLFSETGEYTHGGDLAFTGQLAYNGIPDGSVSASWLVKYDESDLSRSVVGVAGDKRFGKYASLYAQGRLDTISEVWSEVLAGVRTSYVKNLTAGFEYFRSVPTFDATSIYSVFAADRYQELALRADYEVTQRFSVEGEFRNESYGGGDTANVGEAGLRWRMGDRSSVLAAAIFRNGTGGNLRGFEVSGDTVVAKNYLLAAGYQGDVYRRDLMTGYESANRFWLGAEAKVAKNVSVSGRVEENFNHDWNSDLRMRLALNLDF